MPSLQSCLRALPLEFCVHQRLISNPIHHNPLLKSKIEPLLSLELLHNRLTAFPDYMLAFIYLAYAMMTLLLETVPAFEDTWIECLGDLGRYRMAIRDDKVQGDSGISRALVVFEGR